MLEALQALKEALQCLEVKARREAIASLHPRVRAALLGFMAQEVTNEGRNHGGHRRQVAGTREPALRDRSSLWILQRGDVPKFKGRVYFGSLCLTTREQDDRESALGSQAILEQLRDAVTLASAAKPEVWEDVGALLHLCSHILAEGGTSAAALGLSACVTLRTTRWLGDTRIVTPASSLSAALTARKRLVRARATSWQALRAEWIASLQGSANKRTCSLQQAEAIVDSARCKALKTQLSQAIGAVEASLWLRMRRSCGETSSMKRAVSQTEPRGDDAKRCRPALASCLSAY